MAGDAEVEDVWPVLGEYDVGVLEVPVGDAGRVYVGKCEGRSGGEGEEVLPRSGPWDWTCCCSVSPGT